MHAVCLIWESDLDLEMASVDKKQDIPRGHTLGRSYRRTNLIILAPRPYLESKAGGQTDRQQD